MRLGWDSAHGGLFNEGAALVGPVGPATKPWWVQAENLNALLLMHERFGGETSEYWERFVAQWRFIRAHSIDHGHGGWYWRVETDGGLPSGKSSIRGWEWKDPCHEARALFLVEERLGLSGAVRERG